MSIKDFSVALVELLAYHEDYKSAVLLILWTYLFYCIMCGKLDESVKV